MGRMCLACALACAIIVGWCPASALGQDLTIRRFDNATDADFIGQWWANNGATSDKSVDFTMDAAGSPTSGSMKMVVHFTPTTPGDWTSVALFGWLGLGDVTEYASLEADMYIDAASAGSAGDHGWFEWAIRGDADPINFAPGTNLGSGAADGQWFHVSIPLTSFPGSGGSPSSLSQVTFLGFQLGSNSITGDVTFWIDNISLKRPITGGPDRPYVINRFNDPAEVDAPAWHMEDWTEATGEISFDPDKDAGGGGTASGSLKVVLTYSATYDCDICLDPAVHDNALCPDEAQQEPEPHRNCNNTWLVRQFDEGIDFSLYGSLEMDIMVTADSARRGVDGDHGYMAWFTRTGDNWEDHFPGGWGTGNGNNIQGEVWNDDVWYHLVVPLGAGGIPTAGLNDVRAITQQLWGGDTGTELDGPVTIWIDNVMFVPPPQPPKAFFVVDQFNADTGEAEVTSWRGGNADPGVNASVAANAPPAYLTFDPAVDYGGDANSGSMKITIDFDTATYSNSEVQIQKEIFTQPVDFRDYEWFTAKVKVQPGSANTPWGDHGWSGWVFRDFSWSWTPIGGAGIPPDGSASLDANGWFSYSIRFKRIDAPPREFIQRLTYQFGGLQTGPYTMWVDDIKIGRVPECADPNQCEICNDLVDNNGNELVDCDDPDCPGTYACPKEDVCDDHQDNDGDSLTDCADPDCSESTNCHKNDPFADFDGDGDVDQRDFAAFQACFNGPNVHAASGCGMFDTEADGDVDTADWVKFNACVSGPSIQADTTCDD